MARRPPKTIKSRPRVRMQIQMAADSLGLLDDGRRLIEWLTTLIRVHVLQASERVEGIKLSEFRVTVRPEWHIYRESVRKRASCCRLPKSEGSREMK